MKKNKVIIILLMFFIIILSNVFNAYAISSIPNEILIHTENEVVGNIHYDNYTISAYKIISNKGVGYCLEIDKDYPNGQLFKLKGDAKEDITNILTEGFPNRSPAQLNLNSDEEAYFATQIAIWSAYEGYDVHKFYGANKRILKAIIDIYEKSKREDRSTMYYKGKEYHYDENKQDVVMLFMELGGLIPEPPSPPINPEPPVEPSTPPVSPELPIEPSTKPELPQTGGFDYYNYIEVIGIVFISVGIYMFLRKTKVQ